MRLLNLHKLLTYVLVLIPFMVLVMGGEMNPLMSVIFAIGVAGSWFWEHPYVDPNRWSRALMVATLIALVLTVTRLIQGGELRIEPLVDLVLMLTVIKLMQRRTAGDYVQVMALSFLLMTAASAFNQGLVFALAFAVYMVAGTIALAVKHLREELSEHHPKQLEQYRPESGLLATVAGLAVVVFVFSLVFFVTFPRMGFGLFNRVGRTGLMASGFSDSVSLGQHGRVRDDNTVVLRVQFPTGRWTSQELRWRGTSFDTYDGVRWTRQTRGRGSALMNLDGLYVDPRGRSLDVERATIQEMYLEPLGSDVLFGLPQMVAVSFPEEDPDLTMSFFREYVKVGSGSEFYLERTSATGVRYFAHTIPQEMPIATRMWPGGETNFRRRDRSRDHADDSAVEQFYLQLPDNTSEEMRQLAREMVEGAETPYEMARQIETTLREDYEYTTDLPRVDRDNPVDSFLFDTRRGHCEYFATAMALLTRAVGIPSRNVNGFLGGDWNRIGSFYAVRQSHAHSWVEVYLPGTGWATFDPTPASGWPTGTATGVWAGVMAFFDSVRMLWYRHVVDYSLENQIDAVRSVVGLFGEDDDLLFELRRLAFSAFRNMGVVTVCLILWLIQAGLFTRRHRAELMWGWRDVAIGAGALGLTELLVIVFWRPDPNVRIVFMAACLPALTWLAAWVVRQSPEKRSEQRRSRRKIGPVSRVFVKLVQTLTRSGYDYGSSSTPQQLVEQARARQEPYADDLASVIALYERCRFGPPAPSEFLTLLKRRAGALKREIKRGR